MVPIQYNLRSLVVRKATTIATALGIALVVFVLSASLMLSAGVRKTLRLSGRDDVAIVLRNGSDNELSSSIEDSRVSLIEAMPGVVQSGPIPPGVGEVVVVGAMEKIGSPGVTNMQIRGVTADVMHFRPSVHIIAGRPLRPGADEAIVGARIRGRFRGVDLGQTFELKKNRPVTVVGVFADDGSSYESEVWVDLDAVRTSYRRDGAVSSVRVRLESPSKFDAFKAEVEHDKRLGLMAMRETDYYEKQSEGTSTFISVIGWIVSVFFSAGAIIGAMITMYAAVAHRRKEIGTLRALGFPRSSILLSFVLESTTLALAGGVLGAVLASAMGSVKFSVMNFASWSEMVFSFEPTPRVIGSGLVFALVMGLAGGFFPALRASRVSPVAAIRGE